MARVNLYSHQIDALKKIHNGSILCGGVGSGKSITSLAYYYTKVLSGEITDVGYLKKPKTSTPLYIITTARKRDTLEWDAECLRFQLSSDQELSINHIFMKIDSWNNIGKYENVENAFFIFDEQRVVGAGSWSKSFLKIAKKNRWILLSATPGDVWMDYIPVFIANGFYKNRTEFVRKHVVFSRFSKYPKVDRYLDTGVLESLRRSILVTMEYKRPARPHYIDIPVRYNEKAYEKISKKRWNIYSNEPLQDAGSLCFTLRRLVNSDQSRFDEALRCCREHRRLIIFYNFDYELEALRDLAYFTNVAEWNGHKHEPIPSTENWAYLVQYTAGAEGWNCIETDSILFYSQSYSYKAMTQAAGRIDRMNTKFTDLYYYTLKSFSKIDQSISLALKSKKNFNEKAFFEESYL